MYMTETVGIAELRQNLSRHLQRVRAGERLVVTDRNRPVATLGPPPGTEDAYERLTAEAQLIPAHESGPIRLRRIKLDEPYAASQALDAARGGER
jgi:prevent-host-death family protein